MDLCVSLSSATLRSGASSNEKASIIASASVLASYIMRNIKDIYDDKEVKVSANHYQHIE
jgi:hypothetical protein